LGFRLRLKALTHSSDFSRGYATEFSTVHDPPFTVHFKAIALNYEE
jgi:hypothetical protein